MRTIQPGESLVYQFRADYAGIFMYHCGTAPALHHIGNGMYGAVIIDPPDLPPVDHEYVFVQIASCTSARQAQPGDLTKMTERALGRRRVQRLLQPVQVPADPRRAERAGPGLGARRRAVGELGRSTSSARSSTPCSRKATYLLQPDDGHGGSQALDLQPAQGGFVEFSFAEDGLYPIVTHKFANVGKGARGSSRSATSTRAPSADTDRPWVPARRTPPVDQSRRTPFCWTSRRERFARPILGSLSGVLGSQRSSLERVPTA